MTELIELPAGIQHGTPDGHAAGCKGERNCPARYTHGMTCTDAHVRSMTTPDRYFKARSRNPEPAEIARTLGFRPASRSQDAEEQSVEKARSAAAQKAAAKRRARAAAPATEAPTPAAEAPPVEEPTHPAPAPAVEKPEPAAETTVDAAPAEEEPTPKPAQPSQRAVREWAKAHNIDVNQRGSIRSDVMDAYLAAHADPPTEPAAPVVEDTATTPVDDVGDVATPRADTTPTVEEGRHLALPGADVTVTDLDAWAADHDPTEPAFTEQLDDVRARITEPTTLDGATTAPPDHAAVTTAGEFAARWNTLDDDARERWVRTMRADRDTADRAFHGRPEWSEVTTSQDVERARTLAAHLEAENALLLAENALLAGQLTSAHTALTAWEKATTALADLGRRLDRTVALLIHRETSHQTALDAAAQRHAELEGQNDTLRERIAQLTAATTHRRGRAGVR